jgi:cell fate regulator YaaT (PSP1 superfamily)
MSWVGEFRVPPQTVLKHGARVVIQSDRGIELGEQVNLTCQGCGVAVNPQQIRTYIDNSGAEFYRLEAGKILREASPQDCAEHERLNAHIHEDVARCVEQVAKIGLDMRVITAEHLLGGERIVFYFRSEGRIDFRELVRGLAQHYQTRIEMRQVGSRDEARLIADYEVCGRECCCKNFLKKLRPISMRMAKLQKSTLDEGYDELVRKLPRAGARVQTEFGTATVLDRQVLTQLLLVRGDDGRELSIPVDEIGKPPMRESKPATPAPESDAPAADTSADTQTTDTPVDRPRRRRRGRRSRRSADGDPNQAGETGRPETSAFEAPAAPPESGVEPKPSAPANGESEQNASPTRRRRRRRSRRGPSGRAPGTGRADDNQVGP